MYVLDLNLIILIKIALVVIVVGKDWKRALPSE